MHANREEQSDSLAEDDTPEPLSTDELLGWVEFACWTALALTPALYYVNGPSVSTDQAVVRTALVVLAAGGAVALRAIRWMRERR